MEYNIKDKIEWTVIVDDLTQYCHKIGGGIA